MSTEKLELPTGACHALLLGMLDPKIILSVEEDQVKDTSWKPNRDRFYREGNLTFDTVLQHL